MSDPRTAPPPDCPRQVGGPWRARCQHIACRYHLHEPKRPRSLPIYCALDASDTPHTEEEIADIMGFTKAYIQKLERSALEKLRKRGAL